MDVCHSDVGWTLDDLLRNIQRSGPKAPFTLVLGFPHVTHNDANIQRLVTSVDRDGLSRCRSLTLRTLQERPQYSIKSLMDNVLRPPNRHLAALERFRVEAMEHEAFEGRWEDEPSCR